MFSDFDMFMIINDKLCSCKMILMIKYCSVKIY